MNTCNMEEICVKKRKLGKRLRELGWFFQRQGANHEIWTNGKECVAVPRHSEIKEFTAKEIIRVARNCPPLQKRRSE